LNPTGPTGPSQLTKTSLGDQPTPEGTRENSALGGIAGKDAKIARIVEQTKAKPIGKHEITQLFKSLARSKEQRSESDLRIIL